MGEEWNQAPYFVIKPLLISEEEVEDHHRCANEVVVEVSFEEPCFREKIDEQVHILRPFCGFSFREFRLSLIYQQLVEAYRAISGLVAISDFLALDAEGRPRHCSQTLGTD